MMPPVHITIAATGAAVMIKSQRSLLPCAGLALLSHYAADALPHLEPSLLGHGSYLEPLTWPWIWAMAENAVALLIVISLWWKIPMLHNWRFPLMSFLAWMPDTLEPLYTWIHFPVLGKLALMHTSSHWPWRTLLGVYKDSPASPEVWGISAMFTIVIWISAAVALQSQLQLQHKPILGATPELS